MTEHVSTHATPVATGAPTLSSTATTPVAGSASNQVEAKAAALLSTRLSGWRPDAFALGTILLLTAIASWHRLWLQHGLAHLDIPTFYLPWYAYMGEHLRAFDLPGWNPHIFSGVPFAGDPQSGWMYFPAMLIFPFFDSVRAYEIMLIFHLVMAGIGAYAYARVIGLRPIAALVAACVYEFGPLVNHISCCLIHVQLAIWVPIALLGIELMVRSGTWLGRSAAWVLTGFAVSQMLSGWVGQGMYNGLIVVGTYLAFRLFLTAVPHLSTWRRKFIRLVVDGAGILTIGFGIGAAGMLPRLDIVRRTNLAGGEYSGHEVDKYAGGWPLRLFIDRMFTDDNGFRTLTFYLGAPAVVLAIMAPFLARSRFRVPYFVLLFLFTGIMSLKHTPFHDLVYLLLPRYEGLHTHVPNRIFAIQWIAPAMLAGAAVHVLAEPNKRRTIHRAAIAGTAIWTAIMGITTLIDEVPGPYVLIGGYGVCAVAWWLSREPNAGKLAFRPAWRPAAIALIALLVIAEPAGRGFVDTLVTGQGSQLLALPTGPVPRDAIPINASKTDAGGAGEFFQAQASSGEIFRFIGYDYALKDGGLGFPSTYREFYWLPLAQSLLVNARAMPLGLYDAQGYNPMQLTRYVNALLFANHEEQNYHDAQFMANGLDSPILDMLNVRYIVIPNNGAPGRTRDDLLAVNTANPEVFRNDIIRVVENEGTLERAWIVHEVAEASPNFSLLMIDSGLVDPAQRVFLEIEELPAVAAPAAGAQESVTITHDGADQLKMTATLASDGIVVISDTYEPGWKAYVDGEQVDLMAANGVIQALAVPAGTHEIELVYEPLSLQLGIFVSLAFMALSVVIVGLWLLVRRGHVWLPLIAGPRPA